MIQRCSAGKNSQGLDRGQKTKSTMSISSFVLKIKGPEREGAGGAVGKSDLPVSVWRALGPCDRSGRGGASPAGSTEHQACPRAACRTPAGAREREIKALECFYSTAVGKFLDWWGHNGLRNLTKGAGAAADDGWSVLVNHLIGG